MNADPNTGRVALVLPGAAQPGRGSVLAVEVSTKPFINMVWLGAILMLGSTFLIMIRRVQDLGSVPQAEGEKTA